jgi:hypothetical protein
VLWNRFGRKVDRGIVSANEDDWLLALPQHVTAEACLEQVSESPASVRGHHDQVCRLRNSDYGLDNATRFSKMRDHADVASPRGDSTLHSLEIAAGISPQLSFDKVKGIEPRMESHRVRWRERTDELQDAPERLAIAIAKGIACSAKSVPSSGTTMIFSSLG